MSLMYDKFNVSAVMQAASKPTYKNYKFLLAHRRTLQCFKTNLDLMVQAAYDALLKVLTPPAHDIFVQANRKP